MSAPQWAQGLIQTLGRTGTAVGHWSRDVSHAVSRRKPVEQSILAMSDPTRSLKRELTAWDLAILGVAVAVGAGIFSVGATAAANYAGPGVIISFIIAAVVCGLAVMCYAEFASTLPVSGSAYTYSYTTMGELIAWIIGWDLILEMMLAASVIAKFWGVYLADAFRLFDVNIPLTFDVAGIEMTWAPILIVGIFTTLLVLGTKLSTRVTNIFTIIKVGITLFVIVAGASYIKLQNYSPLIPPSQPAEHKETMEQPLFAFLSGLTPTTFGVVGVLSAAALVFFAFIGFDVVATTAEEAKDPQRTLPRGILGGLVIVSILYILVTLVVTGMVSYQELGATGTPSLTTAFELVGATWAGKVISIGILFGLTTVVMVLLLGLSRIVFSMSRDGLLPRAISKTSPKYHTPVRLQIGVGIVIALIAGVAKVELLEEMINIGTLSAFVLVSFGIPILRRTRPDLKRGFRVPWSPWLPIASGIACLWLMTNLTVLTWLRFLVWLLAGFAIWFFYGRRRSILAGPEAEAGTDTPLHHSSK